MIQLEEFPLPYAGPIGALPPVKMINLITNSHAKELKNKDFTKEIEDKRIDGLFVDIGPNIHGKKVKKKEF